MATKLLSSYQNITKCYIFSGYDDMGFTMSMSKPDLRAELEASLKR